jgi:hypothetical protein
MQRYLGDSVFGQRSLDQTSSTRRRAEKGFGASVTQVRAMQVLCDWQLFYQNRRDVFQVRVDNSDRNDNTGPGEIKPCGDGGIVPPTSRCVVQMKLGF